VTEILDGWKLGPANPGYPGPLRGHTVAVVSWRRMVTLCFHSRGFFLFAEYATVGYMAKRIQMRKNRFQKIAESMKAASENPGPPRVPGDHGDHAPKQTVSSVGQSAVVFDEFLSLSRRESVRVFRLLSPSSQSGDSEGVCYCSQPGARFYTLFFQRVDDRLCRRHPDADLTAHDSYIFLHIISSAPARSHAAPESRGTSFLSRLRRSIAKRNRSHPR
jgi:hypothetical protein